MSNFGIATEAPVPAEAVEHKTERHLTVVNAAASIAVAAEYDYFNDLSGDEQIPCGD